MIDYLKQILANQYQAALCMLNQCVAACEPAHWEGKIANDTFRQISYHTLFFSDLYLTASEDAFVLRDLHRHGGDERGETLSAGLSKVETLEYVGICRSKIEESLAIETAQSLLGGSGFSWRKGSRGELHIYNIRHIQHHAGQMSAYLRRVDPKLADFRTLPWVGTGWK